MPESSSEEKQTRAERARGSCSKQTLAPEQLATRTTTVLSGIPNKRDHLARVLARAGVLGVLECFVLRFRPCLIVLTYHRIANPGTDLFYEPVISATPESFRSQIKWLRSHVRLVTLDELDAQIQTGSPWREPVVLLSFDDAYRDNFDVAAPILREYRAPATFFVPTGFLETPSLAWWDAVAYVIKKTQVRRLTLDRRSQGTVRPWHLTWRPRREPRQSRRSSAHSSTTPLAMSGRSSTSSPPGPR